MNISIKLCEHIRERIIPQYVNFDKAHRIDHVEKVIEESMKLALHYEVNSAMVYTIAAYHDLGLCEGREFHHIVSGKILFADETLWQWFTDERFRKHLADKYAEGGYLKLWIPQSDNAGRLAELRQLITNEERIRRVFDQLYEEESILPKIRNL